MSTFGREGGVSETLLTGRLGRGKGKRTRERSRAERNGKKSEKDASQMVLLLFLCRMILIETIGDEKGQENKAAPSRRLDAIETSTKECKQNNAIN